MKVEFIKAHTSGFKKGDTADLKESHAARLVGQGHCKAVEEESESFKELLLKQQEERKPAVEPEFVEHVVSQKDVNAKLYKGKKVGDIVKIKNPKFKKEQ